MGFFEDTDDDDNKFVTCKKCHGEYHPEDTANGVCVDCVEQGDTEDDTDSTRSFFEGASFFDEPEDDDEEEEEEDDTGEDDKKKKSFFEGEDLEETVDGCPGGNHECNHWDDEYVSDEIGKKQNETYNFDKQMDSILIKENKSIKHDIAETAQRRYAKKYSETTQNRTKIGK